MKRQLVLAWVMATMTMACAVNAQRVTVNGMGVNENAALQDAMRNAVEQVVGTYVVSNTLVQQSRVEMDKIYAKSGGFVRDSQILKSVKQGGKYVVTANVDVNTDPNSQLMNDLGMVMALNNPRIAVVILRKTQSDYSTSNNSELDNGAVVALSGKLLDLGFSHVVDAEHLLKRHNQNSVNNYMNGSESINFSDVPADFIVMGVSSAQSKDVRLLDSSGSYRETQLVNGMATINAKIIRADNGEIVGVINAEDRAVSNEAKNAEIKAVQATAVKVANQLEEKFRKISAAVESGLQLEVTSDSYEALTKFSEALRSVRRVNNVYVREFGNGKAVLDVDTLLKSYEVVHAVQGMNGFQVFVEEVTAAKIRLSLR